MLTKVRVIGEPTGTSVKFANMMGSAVKKFFEDSRSCLSKGRVPSTIAWTSKCARPMMGAMSSVS
jgi:hypothetical protein